MSHDSSPESPEAARPSSSKSDKGDKYDQYDANIRNFAPVARIMKNALPDNAKIAKEAKECMQECVSEFISFITSEGEFVSDRRGSQHIHTNNTTASEKCHQEKRKTVNGEDILFAMTSLGFENYSEALKIYLAKYREVHFPFLCAVACAQKADSKWLTTSCSSHNPTEMTPSSLVLEAKVVTAVKQVHLGRLMRARQPSSPAS